MYTRDNADSVNDSSANASTEVSLSSDQNAATSPTHSTDAEAALASIDEVRKQLQTVIRGKEDVIDSVLTALLAEGSILLEDVPGVGKTTLAKALATLIDLDFQRVQCTPDLLPADILGSSIFQPATGEFTFRRGPVFCELLIADEVNRASPRTQSALLEAMAERQVTIEGQRYPLRQPFLVIATQNPSGFEGTFPLPESQLDRFLFRLSMNYPDADNEIDLLLDQATREPIDSLKPVMTRDELLQLQSRVRSVTVDLKVAGYLVAIASGTRQDSRLRVGCSPRGSKMLLRAAQAHALLKHRDFVLPDDVQAVAVSVLAHRLSTRGVSQSVDETTAVVNDLLRQVEVPV